MVYMMGNNLWAYCRYYIKSNKRLFILASILLFLLMPFLAFNLGGLQIGGTDAERYLNSMLVLQATSCMCGCVLSFLIPIFNFRYLYKKRSHEMYYALPIKRKQLFQYTYISGLVVMYVPLTINYLIGFLVNTIFGLATLPIMALVFFLGLCFLLLVMYSLFSFLSVKCNNLIDSILINGAYVVLPLIILLSANTFFSTQIQTILGEVGANVSEFVNGDMLIQSISAPAVLQSFLIDCINVLGHHMGIYDMAHYYNWLYLVYWGVIGALCYWFAQKTFIERKPEDSQQRTKTIFGYPLIITIITFCMILFIMNMNTGIIVPSLIILMLYFCMIFFSNRKIHIKKQHVLVFALIYLSTFGFSYLYTQTKGFGMVKEFPQADTLKAVQISVNRSQTDYQRVDGKKTLLYPFEASVSKKPIDSFVFDSKKKKVILRSLTFQELLSERRLKEERAVGFYVDIYYTKKDNTMIYRHYAIPYEKSSYMLLQNILDELDDMGTIQPTDVDDESAIEG